MKQKFNELLDRPWTTRGYLKFMGIVYVITIIYIACWTLWLRWTDVCDWFKSKFSKEKADDETE